MKTLEGFENSKWSEKQLKWQNSVMEQFKDDGIEGNVEEFILKVETKDKKIIRHHLPKKENITIELTEDPNLGESVKTEEAIEALFAYSPKNPHISLKEAILKLREDKKTEEDI